MPLGEWNQKKLLLVEGAGIVLLPGFYDMLEECFEAGYTPVIAHPERYPYLEKNDCIKLKERGCLFQLNIPSLHGYYGKHVRQAAFTLLDRGMYDFAGFDIHRYEGYAAVIRQLCLTRKRLDKLGPSVRSTPIGIWLPVKTTGLARFSSRKLRAEAV